MRTVSFHKLAEQELNEAAAYYYAARPALGEAFLAEIRHRVQSIAELPKQGLSFRDRYAGGSPGASHMR